MYKLLSNFSITSSQVFILLAYALVICSSQRVAPGVPPQHYDPNAYQQPQGGQYAGHGHGHAPPPPPPQQYQQQQVPIQQQMPVQQQHQAPIQHQVPIQQHVQQPPPVQQHGVPVQQAGHGHGHQHPGHGQGHIQPVLDTKNIGQERQHIQEHMDVPIDTSQMTEQELQFHYFKMHDTDNNNKLDGCELVKSLIHWHDESNHDSKAGHPIPEAKVFKDDELVQMIDPILDNDDKNKDGFIDYGEFVQAQAAAASRNAGQNAA